MAAVFISFVHEDQKVAEAVQRYLSEQLKPAEGVFLSSDQWQVFAGEIWLDRIKEELTAARVVILMLSARSVVRPWVNFEAGAAWLFNKAIVPVCYGKLSKETLPRPYSGIQSLDLPNEKYYLLTSVAHHLGMMAPPPEVPGIVRRLDEVMAGKPAEERADAVARLAERLDSLFSIEAALQGFEDV